MTKKDYRAIARAIYTAYQELPTERSSAPEDVRNAIMVAIACAMEDDNPRFDRATFILACEDGNVTRRPKRARS